MKPLNWQERKLEDVDEQHWIVYGGDAWTASDWDEDEFHAVMHRVDGFYYGVAYAGEGLRFHTITKLEGVNTFDEAKAYVEVVRRMK
jgi:hypothetical protein